MPDLASTFVVLTPQLSTATVALTPTVFEELDARFDQFRGHVLVATFRFEADWPTWEIHPQGDEVVVLLSGRAEMVLDEGGKHRTCLLERVGEFVIVPKATWHTARIATPTTLLFVTPGEGTENRPA